MWDNFKRENVKTCPCPKFEFKPTPPVSATTTSTCPRYTATVFTLHLCTLPKLYAPDEKLTG
jgi:hypothetical protein